MFLSSIPSFFLSLYAERDRPPNPFLSSFSSSFLPSPRLFVVDRARQKARSKDLVARGKTTVLRRGSPRDIRILALLEKSVRRRIEFSLARRFARY